MTLQVIDGLFGGGSILSPPKRSSNPLRAPAHIWRGAAWAVAAGWLPLLGLVIAQAEVAGLPGLPAFFADRGVQCRALLAVPVLILGRAHAYPQLSAMCAHFLDGGLIAPADDRRFNALLASTRRLEASPWAPAVAMALAYSLVIALVAAHPTVPAWHLNRTSWLAPFSPAGWWHVLVCVPLLVVLLLGWLWRLALWARLLWTVAQFDLELVPSHPDRAAGLKFVGFAVRAFAPAGFALGVIVAGALANEAAREALSLTLYRNTGGGLLLFVVLVCSAPLVVFVRPLSLEWQRGIHQYGCFAQSAGQGFERKWLRGGKPDGPALDVQDFSALTDLYQCVANVYAMRVLPIDVQSTLLLGIATLLPILVVALTSLPADVIRDFVARMLF